jgi:Ca2+-binding EF-hand superfamily protein
MKRIIRHSEKNSKKQLIDNYINETQNGTINKYQFYNLLKKLNLGLTNTEIEEIILKEGFSCDGFIDLNKFNKFIFKDDYNLNINKKHIEEKLSEIKPLIIKYYTSPLLAFELNITNDKKFLNFDRFKRLIYEVFQKEKKDIPSFPLLKCLFDYIDYKKDGVISLEEWNHIFSKIKTNLDLDNLDSPNTKRNNNKIINLKKWENSHEIIKIFKLISRNRKLIKEKFKLFSIASSCLLIHTNDLINILKEVLYNLNLTNEQWKMIINIGKKDRTDYIDFKTFITIIEYASKII